MGMLGADWASWLTLGHMGRPSWPISRTDLLDGDLKTSFREMKVKALRVCVLDQRKRPESSSLA